MLMICGAEVYRVENTLNMMARAYGAEKSSIFVITSNIVISMDLPGGIHATDTRRILKSGKMDFYCLEKLNAISRQYCTKPIPLPELKRQVDACSVGVSHWWVLFGSVLAAGAFCVFFGGTLLEGIVAAISALIIYFFQFKVAAILSNSMLFNLATAFALGTFIFTLSAILPYVNADRVLIGDIMLLIPGVAMTNSLRDILLGDTISGTMRLVETLMWAVGLALGMMLSMWFVGGIF